MTARDFAYWLQGYFELANPKILTETQLKQVKNHLDMVFKHEIDPSHGDAKHQEELSKEHNKGLQELLKNPDLFIPGQTKLNC